MNQTQERGRSRKKKQMNFRQLYRFRRLMAFILSFSMILGNVGNSAGVVLAGESGIKEEFRLHAEDIQAAAEKALSEGSAVLDDLGIGGKDKSLVKEYEKLFAADGSLYEIFPAMEQVRGVDDMELRVFLRIAEGADPESYVLTGDEKLLFLYVNSGDQTAAGRLNIDGKVSGFTTVRPYDAVFGKTETPSADEGAGLGNDKDTEAGSGDQKEPEKSADNITEDSLEGSTEDTAGDQSDQSNEDDPADTADDGESKEESGEAESAAEDSDKEDEPEANEPEVKDESGSDEKAPEAESDKKGDSAEEAPSKDEAESSKPEDQKDPSDDKETEDKADVPAEVPSDSKEDSADDTKTEDKTDSEDEKPEDKAESEDEKPEDKIDSEDEKPEDKAESEDKTETKEDAAEDHKPEDKADAPAEEKSEEKADTSSDKTEDEASGSEKNDSKDDGEKDSKKDASDDKGSGRGNGSDRNNERSVKEIGTLSMSLNQVGMVAANRGSDSDAEPEEEEEDHEGDPFDAEDAAALEEEEASFNKVGSLGGRTYNLVSLDDCMTARAFVVSLSKVGIDVEELEEDEILSADTLEASAGNIQVIINAPAGALPEGTTVEANLADSDAVAEAVMSKLEEQGLMIADISAVDITFYDQAQNEVQPSKAVEVILNGVACEYEAEQAFIYHIDDSGNAERLAEVAPDADTAVFRAESFSVFAKVDVVNGANMISLLSSKPESTVEVTRKTSDNGFDEDTVMLPVGVISADYIDNKFNIKGYTFKYAKLAQTEIYAVAVDENGTVYVTMEQDQMTGIPLDDSKEIILYYVPNEDAHKVSYQVFVDGDKAEVTSNGEAKTGNIIHTKIIGAKEIVNGQDLRFSFSKKEGYEVTDVTYKIGNDTTDISMNNGVYTIGNVSGDVEVTIRLQKTKEYEISFRGSNTTYYYEPLKNGWDTSDSNKNKIIRSSYSVNNKISFSLEGRNEHDKNAKILNKLAIRMGDSSSYVNIDIPGKKGESKTTTLANGVTVTIRKENDSDLPLYPVIMEAPAGSELHGNIDVDTNFMSADRSEVWVVELIGAETYAFYPSKKIWGKDTFEQLEPGVHKYLLREKTRGSYKDTYVYINVENNYDNTVHPKVTVLCNGTAAKFDLTLKEVDTGNTNGMTQAREKGCEYYFTIPASETANDIRIMVTAYSETKEFAVNYDYVGGTDSDGNSSNYIDDKSSDGTPYINGSVVRITDGKSAEPTKDGFVFAGWKLGDEVYQTGDPFVIDDKHAGSLAEFDKTTGKYVYHATAVWVEADQLGKAKYTIQVRFGNADGTETDAALEIEEYGSAGKTAVVLKSQLEKKIDAAVEQKAIPLSNEWRAYYELDDAKNGNYSVVVKADGSSKLTVTYKRKSYNFTVKYLDQDDTAIQNESTSMVKWGAEVKAEPANIPGYKVTEKSVDPLGIGEFTDYTFEAEMPNKDMTVTYKYEKDPDAWVTVSFKAGEHGTLEGTTEFEVLKGTEWKKSGIIVPNIKPERGWKKAGDGWTPEIPNEKTEIKEEQEYTADYVEDSSVTKTLKVTVDYKVDGKIQEEDRTVLTNEVWVNAPDTINTTSFTAKTYEGYQLTKITVNGEVVPELPDLVTAGTEIVYEYEKGIYEARVEFYFDENLAEEMTESSEKYFGDVLTVSPENTVEYKGKTYALDRIENNGLHIGTDADVNVVEVYYESDESGDGIPDKYQKTIVFAAVNGTVDGKTQTERLITLFDQYGNWSEEGSYTLDKDDIPKTEPAEGYTGNGKWDVENGPLGVEIKKDGRATFIITYTDRSEYEASVEFYFDENLAEEKTESSKEYFGDVLTISPEITVEYKGKTYALDRIENNGLHIGTDADVNVVKVYYASDEDGDGIPNKYQITLTYVAEDAEKGTVTGTTKEVHTIYEVTRNEDGTLIFGDEMKAVNPDANVTVTPAEGYEFENWTSADSERAAATYASLEEIRAGLFDSDTVFTAHFKAVDKKDPDDGDDNKPVNPDDNNPGTNPGGDDNNPGTNPGGDDDNPGTNPGGNDNNPGTNPGEDGNNPGTNPGGDDNNPGTNPGGDDNNPINPDRNDRPIIGGGGTGGGGGGTTPVTGGGTAPGTGTEGTGTDTVTIDPEAVPLAALPEDVNKIVSDGITIPDEEVPLFGLPKTGDTSIPMGALVGMMLISLLGTFGIARKRKEDGEA
ncbi:MAG: doubled motif LPXTG anchor domain-containing protein [Lachnospiraceae bacterium]|nr:doubled motif LPXTG anchor domain-containing protein [Lachnospiraceae bacterium]